MRLLCPIVRVSRRIVDYIRHQFPMSYTVASQFVRHDVPGLATTTPHKPLEEALCCSATLERRLCGGRMPPVFENTPDMAL